MLRRLTHWRGERRVASQDQPHHQRPSWGRRAAKKSSVLPSWPTGELLSSSSPCSCASPSCLPFPSSSHVPYDRSTLRRGTGHTIIQVGDSPIVPKLNLFCLCADLTVSFVCSTASYDFLSIQDASKDKVMDVLFVLRDTEGTLNNTCADAGVTFASVVWCFVWRKVGSPSAQCFVRLTGNVFVLSRVAVALCVYVGLRRDRRRDLVGAATAAWISLGSMWIRERLWQKLGLPAVSF